MLKVKYIMLSVVMVSVVMLSVVMLSVVMLSVVMLSVVMLSVVMLNVVMLSVVMPSVTASFLNPQENDKECTFFKMIETEHANDNEMIQNPFLPIISKSQR
jgi:hypothetical protein